MVRVRQSIGTRITSDNALALIGPYDVIRTVRTTSRRAKPVKTTPLGRLGSP